jgi:thiamine biosynthesis lipoprotein
MSVAAPTPLAALSRRALFSGPRTAPDPSGSAGCWLRVYRGAMACRFEVTLAGEDARHTGAAHAALAEASRLEGAWTVFRETSVVADLNRRAADQPVAVDAELFALLSRCRTLHGDVDGAFDITSTPLSRCWGFLAREGRVPSDDEIAAARARVGMDAVELDATSRTVRFRRPGLSLNLGAIGKGAAVDAIAAELRRAGVRHALVSAGASSIVAVGGRGRGWTVDVGSRSPRARIARVWLRNVSLSTSGTGEQFIDAGGRRYGHLIDPRTGHPATGLRSVTVITGDGATADALSTAFFVGGADLARRYCHAHPGVLALVTPAGDEAHTELIGACVGAQVDLETGVGGVFCT